MSTIVLKNTTGKRSGSYVKYEFGEDLFGYFYVDVVRGRKHRAKKLRSMVFSDPATFVRTLDADLARSESFHYVP